MKRCGLWGCFRERPPLRPLPRRLAFAVVAVPALACAACAAWAVRALPAAVAAGRVATFSPTILLVFIVFRRIRKPKKLDRYGIIMVLRLITGASLDAAVSLPYYTFGPSYRPVMSLSNLHSTIRRAFACGGLRMKYIELGGYRGGYAMVDDEDYEYLNQFKWSQDWHGYAQRHIVRSDGTKGTIQMHKDLIPVSKGMVRDHIDGNRLNNTRSNLRVCTQKQNSYNRTKHLRNTTGYKGVSLVANSTSFRAYIKVNYKQINLGCYSTVEEAAAAYNYAAIDYYGEFARLNELPDGVVFSREYLQERASRYNKNRKQFLQRKD